MADTNFDEWYKETYPKLGEFDKLPDDEKKRYKQEFASFETWLAHSKENDTGKKAWETLADSAERQDVIKKFDDAFKAWAKDDQHIDDLTTKTPQEIAKLYEDYAMHIGKMKVNQNQNNPDPNTDWRQAKVDSWKNWCENEHTPAYVYDEDPNEKTALKFDVYKTPEDKQAGKKAATIHYNNPRDVTISTSDDQKAPDLEFFDKLTKEAKKDKIPGVTFDGEMTPEFKTKLAIACLRNGLKMDGFDGKIDTNLLSDEEKKTLGLSLETKIKDYNTKIEYQSNYDKAKEEAAKYAQEHASDKKVAMKDLMGDEKDSTLAAIKYTAYERAGIKVEGVKEFNANNEGTFKLSPKELLPEDVQETAGKHNTETLETIYMECQIKISEAQKDPSKSITLGHYPQGTNRLPLRDALLFAAAKKSGLEIGNDPKKDPGKKVYIGGYKYQPLQMNPYMPEDARKEITAYNENLRQKQLDNINKRREELGKTGTDEQKAQIDERAKFEAARKAIKDGKGTDADRKTVKDYRSKIAAQNRAQEEAARQSDPNYRKGLTTANSLWKQIKDTQNS